MTFLGLLTRVYEITSPLRTPRLLYTMSNIKINSKNGRTAPLEVVPCGTSLHQFAFMKAKSTDREVAKTEKDICT